MREWLNIQELAHQTNIPDTTIRRYISKFSTFFIYKGGARSRRYEDTAVKVLIRIKQLYDDGHESEEVDNTLRNEFSVVIDGDNEESFEKASTPALATADDMAEIKEALKQQQEFNKLLIEKLADQERYIKETLEKRDHLFLESIKTIQEEKALLEAASTEEKKPSFFNRLFGMNKSTR